MNLPEFSVSRRVTITMLILIVALFGVIFFFRLGMDLMPEIDFPMVAVITQYGGVAPEDIEKNVTRTVEMAVSSATGVESVRSISRQGMSVVQVLFGWDTDIDMAAQDIRDSLSFMEDFLPEDAERPLVVKFNTEMMPIVMYIVTGIDDTMKMRKYLSDTLSPRIERLPGVALAAPFGGDIREVQVRVSHDELRKRGLSVDAVIAAVRRENVTASVGNVVEAGSEHLIRALGEFQSVADIENTVVFARGDMRVLVKDVAEVLDTHAETRRYVRSGGLPAVMFVVQKQSGANVVETARAVRKEIENARPMMPEGMRFTALMDQAEIIEKVVENTTSNAAAGGVLAVLFIAVFLWSLRATVTIAVAIPLAILTTFIGMYAIGYTFNVLTLGGLALGVGMLVDNAVVVIENTFRHLENGDTPSASAAKGANEVAMAITASTLTTISVFLPMVLVSGLAGKFAQPLALTVCLALLASLFVAITLVPAIASVVFHGGTAEEYRRRFERGWFNRVRERYRRMLSSALRRPVLVIGTAVLALAAAVATLAGVGAEFIPAQDIPISAFRLRMPVGTPLDKTDAVMRKLENETARIPDVMAVTGIVGPEESNAAFSAGGDDPTDVNEAQMIVRYKYRENRVSNVGTAEIEDNSRDMIPPMPGLQAGFMDVGMGGMSTGAEPEPVAVRVFGPELGELDRLGREVKDRISTVEGLRDVSLSTEEGKPEYRISIDRERAADFGLSVAQVSQTVRAAVQGTVASIYREGGEESNIRVRFEERDRDTLAKIKGLTIASPTGQMVELGQVAKVEGGFGPLDIRREGRQRKVAVTARIKGRDLGTVISDVKARLSDMSVPAGYRLDFGGAYEDMIATLVALMWAFLAAVLLVYMILAAQFESLVQPFIIMVTVPLGIVGVAFGLGVAGMPLSMPSLLGVCILVGIVVNNAIVMIDFTNRLRRDGMEFREAIVEGATARLRPILVTSLTTILGILPMGLSTSQGSEMRAPMGIAIAAGLTFGMVLTLFVIPVIYHLLARKSVARMA